MDKRGRIQAQYQQRVKHGFGQAWMRRLAGSSCAMDELPPGVSNALKEAHFDTEDLKYAETAAGTECNILVSHDRDYSPAVRKILKRLPVHIGSAEEALELPEAPVTPAPGESAPTGH